MKKVLLIIFLFVVATPLVFAFETSEYEAVIAGLRNALVQLEAPDSHTTNFDEIHGRDPLASLLDEQGRLLMPTALHGNFSVQGLILDENNRTVLVDDQFYHEGDMIGKAKIVKIRPNGFLIREDGSDQTTFIPLYPDSDKKDSPLT